MTLALILMAISAKLTAALPPEPLRLPLPEVRILSRAERPRWRR